MTDDVRTYPMGTASWIDLETPDAAAVAPFYQTVFGWTLADAMPPGAPGHYLIATIGGRDVAAIASGVASIGTVSAWNTYFAVDDADTAAATVERAGGRITSPAADTPGGRPVACLDPQGAPFRLWQAGRRLGAQAVNEPGTWVFSALLTGQPDAAFTFYSAVLPWQQGDPVDGFIRVPGYGAHLAATADPGILERQRYAPTGYEDVTARFDAARADAPPFWQVAFSVADRDAAVVAIEQAGGTVHSTSEDDWTRGVVVGDPSGTEFAISQFAPKAW